MKIPSPEVALYLCKSTIHPCMEYCCYGWAGAPNCYLELLDKRQKQICRNFGPSLAAFLKHLAFRQSVASVSLFYRYYFGGCSAELAPLVPLPLSRGKSTPYSDRLHDFRSPFLDVTRISVSTVSFLSQLDSAIICLLERFPLIYDLNSFKTRINRHLLILGSF